MAEFESPVDSPHSGRVLTKWYVTRDSENPEDVHSEIKREAVCEPDEIDRAEGLDAVALAIDVCTRSGAIGTSAQPWGGSLNNVWIVCEPYQHPHQGYTEEYSIHFNSFWDPSEIQRVLRALFPSSENHG